MPQPSALVDESAAFVLFERLTDDHAASLTAHTRDLAARCGLRGLEDDLLQEVWLRVWAALTDPSGPPDLDNPRAWLRELSRRVALEKSRAWRSVPEPRAPASSPESYKPPERIAVYRLLEAHMGDLRADLREDLERWACGCSLSEIGAARSISKQAAHKRVHLALETLRGSMLAPPLPEPYEDDPCPARLQPLASSTSPPLLPPPPPTEAPPARPAPTAVDRSGGRQPGPDFKPGSQSLRTPPLRTPERPTSSSPDAAPRSAASPPLKAASGSGVTRPAPAIAG